MRESTAKENKVYKMELRKDYVINRYVFVNTQRSRRPSDFKTGSSENRKDKAAASQKTQDPSRESMNMNSEQPAGNYDAKCPFCLGNEQKTPSEIGRIEVDGHWDIRWLPNKFPIVENKGNYLINTDNNYFTFSDCYGLHDIIIETPNHNEQFWDFSSERISNILKVMGWRTKEMYQQKSISYVHCFKNHGKDAGASLAHSHSQIIGLNHVPRDVLDKAQLSNSRGSCDYCRIIETESRSFRSILETPNFISFAPYASISNLEVAVFPKAHVRFLYELENQLDELSAHIELVVKKLKSLNSSFNILFFQSPKDYNLHFHIEIHPRLTKWAGLELAGSFVTSITPEDAALFYKGDLLD